MKDYARTRKLDNTAQRNMQHGGEPLDIGAVDVNDNSCKNYWGEDEIEAIGAYAWDANGK